MDQAMAIHPDGTPADPEAMRDALRRGEVPSDWMEDRRLLELVAGDDLEAFTEYMQTVNSDRIFRDDGSAQDINAWRESVRDDEKYRYLLQESYPQVLDLILKVSDDEVQNMLRAQHSAQAQAQAQKHEL